MLYEVFYQIFMDADNITGIKSSIIDRKIVHITI